MSIAGVVIDDIELRDQVVLTAGQKHLQSINAN